MGIWITYLDLDLVYSSSLAGWFILDIIWHVIRKSREFVTEHI